MKIKLERKFAELIDDVNISKYRVGDVIDLPWHDAKMLLAEGWATFLDDEEPAPVLTNLVEFLNAKKSA